MIERATSEREHGRERDAGKRGQQEVARGTDATPASELDGREQQQPAVRKRAVRVELPLALVGRLAVARPVDVRDDAPRTRGRGWIIDRTPPTTLVPRCVADVLRAARARGRRRWRASAAACERSTWRRVSDGADRDRQRERERERRQRRREQPRRAATSCDDGLVPRSAQRADQVGPAELAAQLRDVHVDGARAARDTPAPRRGRAAGRARRRRPAFAMKNASRSNSFAVSSTGLPSTVTSCDSRSSSTSPSAKRSRRSCGSVRRRIAFIRATSSRGENGFVR